MANKITQNRMVIRVACECLKKSGFANVHRNKNQGTFPDVHVTAERDGTRYLIGITGRHEIGADRKPNPEFNLVRSDGDRKAARALAKEYDRVLAFVAVALHERAGTFTAYFGELEKLSFPRAIPMLSHERTKYEMLRC